MSKSQTCLSKNDLRDLKHNQLSQERLEQFESHLTDCIKCRQILDATDVEPLPQWQSEICPVLRETFDIASLETRSDDTARHETFVRLLSPSEDPKMLGRVGNYEVVGIIGQGGMGVVFKAFETSLNRFVAIKMLLPHLTANSAARKRFLREGQAAAAVVDDHVLPIFGVDQWQGTPYLVMKYSGGQTLQQRIVHQGPLDVKEVLRIGMQAARGLAAAHAQGLVHRDVKPSNILLDGSVDRAVLMDFGLARASDDASITRTGIISGTPQYMSPEQVRADVVDARSDLFSLGSTLYAMCAGRPPFRSESAYGVMHRITHEEPTPICAVNADVPPWMGVIVHRLMAKQAEDRFNSADEVADLLEGCLAHVQQPTSVLLPETLAVAASDRGGFTSWRKWLTFASFAFFVALAGLLLVIELNKGKLVIECAADDVPIRIMQGDVEVEKLTVSKDGATIKIAAGKYLVEVDGAPDKVIVEGKGVTLSRGGVESVKIRLDGASIAGPQSSGYASPKKVFEHYQRMVEQKDWKAIGQCVTEDCRDEFIGECLFALVLIKTFNGDSTDSETLKIFHRTVSFLDELQERFPEIAQLESKAAKPDPKLLEALKSLDPNKRRQARIASFRAELGEGDEQLFVALSDFMYSITPENLMSRPSTVLDDLEIGEAKATAVLVDSKLATPSNSGVSERQPIVFKKLDGQWKIDSLVESIYEQMRENNQQIQAVIDGQEMASSKVWAAASDTQMQSPSSDEPVATTAEPISPSHGRWQTLGAASLEHVRREKVSSYPLSSPAIVHADHFSAEQGGNSVRGAIPSGKPIMNVNDAAKAKWGDDEPLEVAKRVFAARRRMLKSFQLSYRAYRPSKEEISESVDASLGVTAGKAARPKDRLDIDTIGFSDTTVYYYGGRSKEDAPAVGWLFDGQKMTWLRSNTIAEPLKPIEEASTNPDFSRLFCGSPIPLQVAGLVGMSETSIPYLDEILESDPTATAQWVLREVDSYAKTRPWQPRFDRMLLVEFEYKIPILPQTEDGEPYSFVSPLRVTYVLDPAFDYWPVWYQTRTAYNLRSFRVLSMSQNFAKGTHAFFPHKIVEQNISAEDKVKSVLEVTAWTFGEPVNGNTVFGDAIPEFLTPKQNSNEPDDVIVDETELVAEIDEVVRKSNDLAEETKHSFRDER